MEFEHVETVFFRIFGDYGSMAVDTAELASWPAVVEGREKELHFSCMSVQCSWSEAAAKYDLPYMV